MIASLIPKRQISGRDDKLPQTKDETSQTASRAGGHGQRDGEHGRIASGHPSSEVSTPGTSTASGVDGGTENVTAQGCGHGVGTAVPMTTPSKALSGELGTRIDGDNDKRCVFCDVWWYGGHDACNASAMPTGTVPAAMSRDPPPYAHRSVGL